MTEQQKQLWLNWYADGFDAYIADGRMPPMVEGDNLIGKYLRGVIDRNPNLGGADPKYRDSFKENLQSFIGEMLDRFSKVDRDSEPEQLLYSQFHRGTTGERRTLWNRVKDLAKAKYSPTDLNAEGYDSQLNAGNEQLIFDMFVREWKEASDKRQFQTKSNILASASARWEKSCNRNCRQDYEMKKRIEKSLYKYPGLAEIARIIGRGHDPTVADDVAYLSKNYRPSSLSRTPSYEEVDRITIGNDIERVIPSEFLYLAEDATEILFIERYARHQLQQFVSPGCDAVVHKQTAAPHPRPVSGPIIVSVDTSSSMEGEPSDMAFAMLHQLLEIARRENRRCYLITFSVRSRAIDLGEPGQWRKIDEFLSQSYTGGTNGELMLRDSIKCLKSENYCMADVLVISDFAFAAPAPDTFASIRREQSSGTRFYGLKIGNINTPYARIFDKIWTV